MQGVRFVWLEITGRCQLECVHCYAESGPEGTHGSMTTADWRRVIDQAARLGVGTVQFIGGEPTLHPDLPGLVDHAGAAGVGVEVFSNLVHVSPAMWETFSQPGVSLACSYYSDDPARHAAVTGRPGSHARTKANIAEAVSRSIPLRVGVIDLGEEQRSERAVAELKALGVTDIGTDRLRQVGRGARGRVPAAAELCGSCASGVLAISATGEVWPCVFSRWMSVGNIRDATLAEITAGVRFGEVRRELLAVFDPPQTPCVPNMCNPQCGPSCSPACRPANNCRPIGSCVPWYKGR